MDLLSPGFTGTSGQEQMALHVPDEGVAQATPLLGTAPLGTLTLCQERMCLADGKGDVFPTEIFVH